MLETPQERVVLLKAGINGKKIEELYIIFNNLKVVNSPVLFNLLDTNHEINNKKAMRQKATSILTRFRNIPLVFAYLSLYL